MSIHKNIYQVDAFTAAPFKGNPACVCLLEKEMPKKWMQNVATEMNLAETAFILCENDLFRIRFFTPETEVPICGHGTLSSAHVLFQAGIVGKEQKITFESKAGNLFARQSGNWIIMDFPSYDFKPMHIPDSAEKLLGRRPVELYQTSHGWTMVVLHSEEYVRNLKPDFSRMKDSPYGRLIVTAPSEDTNFDFCVRCFAPVIGINEDPVTGSAHCALAPYWHRRTGRTEFISRQVSERSGILKVAIKDDRIEIAGHAKTIARGELLV